MAHHPAGIEHAGRPKAEGNQFAERRTTRTAIRSLHEMAGVSEDVAREAMRLASHKLPVKCKFVKKEAAAPAAEGGEANEG